jgi:hypothetical protein
VGLEDDLEILDRSIRQLEIEWGKFFGGVEKKPPVDLKGRVEALVRKYAYSEMRNNADRFRYQTLTAKYNTLNELWSKRLRALEEGRQLGVHGLRADALPPPPPRSAEPAPKRPATGGTGEVRVAHADRDVEAVRSLFDRFVEARRQSGESAAVKFESFQKLIAQQATKILAEKGARAVDFRLETKDGKVSLKAKPVK